MPKEWYDRGANRSGEGVSEEARQFNLRIIADKKPYFMRYIYPSMMKQYNTYISNTNKKCIREFRISVDELLAKPEDTLSEDEKNFLHYYKLKMPVGMNDCVMNRICRRFEEEFDGYIAKHNNDFTFDYTIMKRGCEYSITQYNAIKQLYAEYVSRLQEYARSATRERVNATERTEARLVMKQDFMSKCQALCSNKFQMCDILLDICYSNEWSKQFVWDMSGEEIITNLLDINNGYISFPVQDTDGTVSFGGEKFSFFTKQIGGDTDEYCA